MIHISSAFSFFIFCSFCHHEYPYFSLIQIIINKVASKNKKNQAFYLIKLSERPFHKKLLKEKFVLAIILKTHKSKSQKTMLERIQNKLHYQVINIQ